MTSWQHTCLEAHAPVNSTPDQHTFLANDRKLHATPRYTAQSCFCTTQGLVTASC